MNWTVCNPSLQNCEKKRFILFPQLVFRSLFVARDRKVILRVPLLFPSSKWFWSDPISVVDFVTVWTLLDLTRTSLLAIIIVSGLFLLEFACPEVLLRDCNAGNEGIERPRLRILSKTVWFAFTDDPDLLFCGFRYLFDSTPAWCRCGMTFVAVIATHLSSAVGVTFVAGFATHLSDAVDCDFYCSVRNTPV